MSGLVEDDIDRHDPGLSPIDGSGLGPVLEEVSLQGDPWQRCLALAAAVAADPVFPAVVRRRWSDLDELATVRADCADQRLIWMPEDGDPHLHWQLLRAIGRRQLPVKLVLPYDSRLADWGDWASLDGWWVAAPGHPRECRSLFRRILAEEWPTVVLLPPTWSEIGGVEGFAWGECQCCGDEAEVSLLAAHDSLGIALEARAVLHGLGIPAMVLPCSSIAPLPVHAVRQRERGLVVVIDSGRTWSGLGGLWQRLEPSLDCSYCGAEHRLATPPTASDVVAMVRMQLGL